MSTGAIYKLTCLPTGMCYVGQARDTKAKAGKPYAYGVAGRWNDHVSCVSSTPLGLAIQAHGAAAFRVETLEANVPDNRLDEREAFWIATLNTCVPNGYNKMRHARCRHRESSSLSEFYAPTTVAVRLRQINKEGAPHLIYAYLRQRDGKEVRVVFGQGAGSTYADAVQCATTFLESFATVPIEADPRILNPAAGEYDAKVARFDDRKISLIRVAKFNSLAAVYIDKDRVCFGGKHTTYADAVAKALQFANALLHKHPDARLEDNASKSATGGCSPS